MKTIKEISAEIGVSKSAVHKKLNSKPLKTDIQRHISFVGNKMYIDSDGEEILKSTYIKSFLEIHDGVDEVDNAVDDVHDKVDNIDEQVDEVDNKSNGKVGDFSDMIDDIDDLTMSFILSLQKQIDLLTAQNEDLRKENSKLTDKVLEQSERLFSLTEQAQKLAENAQTLHAMENVKPQITNGKKNIFSKLFSRNK